MSERASPRAGPHLEVVAVRSYLAFAARHRQLVTAAQVASGTGAAKSRVVQRVDEVTRHEHAQGRPLLGAIVSEGRGPSVAFQRLARELLGEAQDRHGTWERERDRVWAFDWDL
jgi:hypothetical protein